MKSLYFINDLFIYFVWKLKIYIYILFKEIIPFIFFLFLLILEYEKIDINDLIFLFFLFLKL